MRFASSAAVLALGLLTSVQATYWCYSTEASCKSQLTDCTLDASTGHYCGNVARKRSIWCYSSEALCASELDDCAYNSSTDEYCGNITKARRNL